MLRRETAVTFSAATWPGLIVPAVCERDRVDTARSQRTEVGAGLVDALVQFHQRVHDAVKSNGFRKVLSEQAFHDALLLHVLDVSLKSNTLAIRLTPKSLLRSTKPLLALNR